MKKLLITYMFFLLPYIAMAGGSWEQVTIKRLTLFNNTDYELVVIPDIGDGKYKDPYMGNCPQFTVIGEYSWFQSLRLPDDVTRKSHKAALAYIENAQDEGKPILLGWMGTGFVPVDPENECIVRSRALRLFNREGTVSVISYHNAV